MTKKIVFIVALVAVLMAGFGLILFKYTEKSLPQRGASDEILFPPNDRDRVDSYIRENINSLSTEETVLGGKFYVTKIVFISNSKARVEYEDGHNAFAAEADFFLEPGGIVKVFDFITIKKN